MGRARLPVIAHLSTEEVARRYRACPGGLEKTHRQVVRLLTRSPEPPAPAAVAEQYWVDALLGPYRPEAL